MCICHEVTGPYAMILVFWMLSFKPAFSLSSFTFIKRLFSPSLRFVLGFFCGSAGKESTCSVGDLGSIPWLRRSPGEGNSYPLQYSGMENSMDCIIQRIRHDWMTFTFTGLSAIRVVSSAYLRLFIFLPAILIPACASSNPAFCMMYSAFKLNKQVDSIQPWRTPFPIWNQSVVPCPVLTIASWPAYRFLRRQVRWSNILISLRIFHSCCDPHSQKL